MALIFLASTIVDILVLFLTWELRALNWELSWELLPMKDDVMWVFHRWLLCWGIFSLNLFVEVFIMSECCTLSKIVFFLHLLKWWYGSFSFLLLIWCITLIHLWILNGISYRKILLETNNILAKSKNVWQLKSMPLKAT